nr:hypothetical protein [Pandoravirus aubagnensis]
MAAVVATTETAPAVEARLAGGIPVAGIEPAKPQTSVWRWVKIALGIIAVLVVIVVIVTVLFGTGCPKDDKGTIKASSLLCGLASAGQAAARAVRRVASNIWAVIGAIGLAIAGFLGLRGRGGEGGDVPPDVTPGADVLMRARQSAANPPAAATPGFRPPTMPAGLSQRPVVVATPRAAAVYVPPRRSF